MTFDSLDYKMAQQAFKHTRISGRLPQTLYNPYKFGEVWVFPSQLLKGNFLGGSGWGITRMSEAQSSPNLERLQMNVKENF